MSSQTAFAPSTFAGLSVQSCTSTSTTPLKSTRRPSKRPSTPRKTTTPVAVLGANRTTPSWGQQVNTTKKFQVTILGKTESKNKVIEVDAETDLRASLLSKGIDVYTLGGKLRNCGGGGQCGTCLISIEDGAYFAGARTGREQFLLSSKPDTWRLACRTQITGDISIRTKPQA